MMKIEIKEIDRDFVIQVEGRLTGAFVPELEHCWKTVRLNQPGRKVAVDLKGLTCIDRAGRYLLQLMHGDGVGFRRAGLAIQDILEEIAESPECRH